jgi:hypothetical protein
MFLRDPKDQEEQLPEEQSATTENDDEASEDAGEGEE